MQVVGIATAEGGAGLGLGNDCKTSDVGGLPALEGTSGIAKALWQAGGASPDNLVHRRNQACDAIVLGTAAGSVARVPTFWVMPVMVLGSHHGTGAPGIARPRAAGQRSALRRDPGMVPVSMATMFLGLEDTT